MDTSAPNISFDDQGYCNFCSDFLGTNAQLLERTEEQQQAALSALVQRVRNAGRGKRYDCIVGVSGGVDSAYTLMKVVGLGLRPLAVHMDNGWNSELAQNNIANLVKGLNVDLHTHVIEWEEYRRLMQAFLDEDVPDLELLYDNAMLKVNYQQAAKWGIHYILSGSNQATEGIFMPAGWNWLKYDKRNIKAIARTQKVKVSSFPAISVAQYLFYRTAKRIAWVPFLDYVDYNKEIALGALEGSFGFKRYPYKHYESILTRFYQGHILPSKFGVDKRRLHLSNLILTGQLNRDSAASILHCTPYPTASGLARDTKYFLKKMHWDTRDLEEYLRRTPVSHSEFASERALWDASQKSWKALRRLPLLPMRRNAP
jgi:N-acetyl sugar amidotransferase